MNKLLLSLSALLLIACQDQDGAAFFKKGKKVKTGEEISADLNSSLDAERFQPSSALPSNPSINNDEPAYVPTTADDTSSVAVVGQEATMEVPEALPTNAPTEYSRPNVPNEPLVYTVPGADISQTSSDPLALGTTTSNSSSSLNIAPNSGESAAPAAVPVTAAETPAPTTAGFYGPVKNTLIIGDSHSSKMGELGEGLINLFSKEGQTDLYSISGSKIDHWLNDQSGEEKKKLLEKMGGSVGSSQNPDLDYDKGNAASYADWNLLKLLEKHQTSRLVLQLGTNHSPNELEAKYIELITKTCQQVSEFFIILPPVQAKKDFSEANKNVEKSLMSFNQNAPASCPPLKVTVSNALEETKYVALGEGTLEKGMYDDYHLWKKPAETAWLEKIAKNYHQDGTTAAAASAPTEKDAVLAALGLAEIAKSGTVADAQCQLNID